VEKAKKFPNDIFYSTLLCNGNQIYLFYILGHLFHLRSSVSCFENLNWACLEWSRNGGFRRCLVGREPAQQNQPSFHFLPDIQRILKLFLMFSQTIFWLRKDLQLSPESISNTPHNHSVVLVKNKMVKVLGMQKIYLKMSLTSAISRKFCLIFRCRFLELWFFVLQFSFFKMCVDHVFWFHSECSFKLWELKMMGDRFYLKKLQEGNAFAQLLRKIVLGLLLITLP
jgi:hypothetical protein